MNTRRSFLKAATLAAGAGALVGRDTFAKAEEPGLGPSLDEAKMERV